MASQISCTPVSAPSVRISSPLAATRACISDVRAMSWPKIFVTEAIYFTMNKKIQLHILKTLAETRERHIFILELHSILGYFGDIPQKQFIHKNSYNSEIICELDYLCEHGFVEYRKSGDVHKNLTCKITAKGL